jgi:hypothetical protein
MLCVHWLCAEESHLNDIPVHSNVKCYGFGFQCLPATKIPISFYLSFNWMANKEWRWRIERINEWMRCESEIRKLIVIFVCIFTYSNAAAIIPWENYEKKIHFGKSSSDALYLAMSM